MEVNYLRLFDKIERGKGTVDSSTVFIFFQNKKKKKIPENERTLNSGDPRCIIRYNDSPLVVTYPLISYVYNLFGCKVKVFGVPLFISLFVLTESIMRSCKVYLVQTKQRSCMELRI